MKGKENPRVVIPESKPKQEKSLLHEVKVPDLLGKRKGWRKQRNERSL